LSAPMTLPATRPEPAPSAAPLPTCPAADPIAAPARAPIAVPTAAVPSAAWLADSPGDRYPIACWAEAWQYRSSRWKDPYDFPLPGKAAKVETAGPGEAQPARQTAPTTRRQKDFLSTATPPQHPMVTGTEWWQEKDKNNLIHGNDCGPQTLSAADQSKLRMLILRPLMCALLAAGFNLTGERHSPGHAMIRVARPLSRGFLKCAATPSSCRGSSNRT
jgi:hypothetical protein